MTWTPEQESIFTSIGQVNLMADALAGTGKTTTKTEAVSRLLKSKPTLFALDCAFNVKTKTESERKYNGAPITVLTMNGMGHRAWGKFTGKNLTLEKNKMGLITSEVTKQADRSDLWPQIRQLSTMAKSWGIAPSAGPPASSSIALADTRQEWNNLADHYDIDCNDEIVDLSRMVLKTSVIQAFSGTIDFDDQIYMSTLWGAPFVRYDLVIVDEDQDLNHLQHSMVKKSLNPGGTFVGFGDERQAIYGFRGASANSVKELQQLFSAQTLPLTVCWRCSKSVIEHAQLIVPQIKYAPDATDGAVTIIDSWDENLFAPGSAILCRNNAPIIALAFRLIRHGKGVHVIGRDIGAALKMLVRKLLREDLTKPISELLSQLKSWKEKELLVAQSRGDEDKIRKITDKAESLFAVIQFSGADTPNKVCENIDKLFSRESAPITLSTIHRAKGLEWNTVHILDSDLLCPPWIKLPWCIEQDQNLDYVARTRAREHLKYISSPGWKDSE